MYDNAHDIDLSVILDHLHNTLVHRRFVNHLIVIEL